MAKAAAIPTPPDVISDLRKRVHAFLQKEAFFKAATRLKMNPLSLAIFAANFAKSRKRVIDQLLRAKKKGLI